MKIKRNAIRCNKCTDIIESKHRHDFKYCDCQAVAVDGGVDYLRRLGDPEDYEDLSTFVEDGVFLWRAGHGVLALDEIDDRHLQNIDHHLRTRNDRTPALWASDQKLRAECITPEMKKRGLEPVDEELPF